MNEAEWWILPHLVQAPYKKGWTIEFTDLTAPKIYPQHDPPISIGFDDADIYNKNEFSSTPPCHRPDEAPAPLEKLAKNCPRFEKYSKISTPLENSQMVLSPLEIEWQRF